MVLPLTPATRLETLAPFPNFIKNDSTGLLELQPGRDGQIVIDSCAEFMEYHVPGTKFSATKDFVLLHDKEGQPMVLSIGNDLVCYPHLQLRRPMLSSPGMQHLYLCAHVNGGAGGWQSFDITPAAGFQAALCSAAKSPDNKTVLVAVSGHNVAHKSKTQLFQLVLPCPTLEADSSGNVVRMPFQSLSFRPSVMRTLCMVLTRYRLAVGGRRRQTPGSHCQLSHLPSLWLADRIPDTGRGGRPWQQVRGLSLRLRLAVRGLDPSQVPCSGRDNPIRRCGQHCTSWGWLRCALSTGV
jgi:hypothetical protein